MTFSIQVVREKLSRANFFLLLGIAITLPLLSHRITNLFILSLTASWLFQGRIVIKNKLVYLFVLFYVGHIVGMSYSANVSQALFELEKKIGFVIFPIILVSITLTDREFGNILKGFVISCFVTSMICLVHATYQYALLGTNEYFFYYPLTDIIGIHPIYLAMYLCFSCFILINWLAMGQRYQSVGNRIAMLLCVAYFVVFIFLLSARAEILALCAIAFVTIVLYYKRQQQMVKAIGLIAFLVVCFGGLIYFNPTNNLRFQEMINYKSQYSIDKQWGGRALRLLKWDCSMEVIKSNLFFGVGPGDTQDELQKCYQDKNYYPLLHWPDVKYNSHNQYLQTAIDLGIIGLAILLFCFFGFVKESVLSKDYLFLSFIGLFALCCLTESMLEVNKGIIFFTFFTSLFVSQKEKPII